VLPRDRLLSDGAEAALYVKALPAPVVDVPAAVVTVALAVPASRDGGTARVGGPELPKKGLTGPAPNSTPPAPRQVVPSTVATGGRRRVRPAVLPEVTLSEVTVGAEGAL